MTWQRIDENTYIDNSLVTCAEYQLFIDEMREQGKYYQPDHWTTYEFSTGQAREPILGVRYTDAVAFCGWLTQRKNKEWRFRLPQQNEVTSSSIKAKETTILGYWIDDTKFEWVGTTPIANVIDLEQIIKRASVSDPAFSLTLNRLIPLDRIIAFDRVKGVDQARSMVANYDVDSISSTYLDIITLQERIAGRSPAFEGIRLVKERIK